MTVDYHWWLAGNNGVISWWRLGCRSDALSAYDTGRDFAG